MRPLIFVTALSLAACATRIGELEGVWEDAGGFVADAMTIRSDGSVNYCSFGCLATFETDCKATMRGNTLVLSEPVQAYSGRTPQRFQYIRREGREFLVLEEDLEDFWKDEDAVRHPVWGLRRRLPKAKLRQLFENGTDTELRRRYFDEWGNWQVVEADLAFLSRVARTDPDFDVRRHAIVDLEFAGRADSNTVVDRDLWQRARKILLEISREAEEPGIRHSANEMLGLGDEDGE